MGTSLEILSIAFGGGVAIGACVVFLATRARVRALKALYRAEKRDRITAEEETREVAQQMSDLLDAYANHPVPRTSLQDYHYVRATDMVRAILYRDLKKYTYPS